MNNKSKVYDEKFYSNRNEGTQKAADRVLGIIGAKFEGISSIVDFGCGVGTWLAAAKKTLRASRVLGLDGKWVDTSSLVINDQEFRSIDFEEGEIVIQEKFDLAISLEVAEHLQEKNGIRLVKLLCSLSDVVLFSAAVPGQGGTMHKNEQWPSYWGGVFNSCDFEILDIIRDEVWNDEDVPFWYKQNMIIAVSRRGIGRLRSDICCTPEKRVKDYVHPELFLKRAVFEQSFTSIVKELVKRFIRGFRKV